MKRVVTAVFGVGAIAAAAVAIRYGQSELAREPDPAPRREQARSHNDGIAPASGLRVDRDATAVFQRAFWRRVGPDVRVLGGERREWLEEGNVQKWRWFVAVQTTPQFRQWLVEQNPFELARVATPTPSDFARPEDAPEWFPAADALAPLAVYRTRGSGLAVFLDEKSGRMFATDSGSGFAAAAR